MSTSSLLSPFFWLSHKNLYVFLLAHTRATCRTNRIPIDLIILIIFGEKYIYEAPAYEFSSSLLLSHFSWFQILSSVPSSQTPSVRVLPLISDTNFHTHTKLLAKL
jgi:hypothetical protein